MHGNDEHLLAQLRAKAELVPAQPAGRPLQTVFPDAGNTGYGGLPSAHVVIERTPLHRPRVSRETRQLLATALAAVIALWVLARIRFPDRPATPVPALLTQLAPRQPLGDLALESAMLRSRLGPSVVALPTAGAAVRIRGDAALTWLPAADAREHGQGSQGGGQQAWEVLSRDRATGLAIVRLDAAPAASAPSPWTPDAPNQPRYLLGTVVSPGDVALRPLFIASLEPAVDPAWPDGIWVLPAATDADAGDILFTTDAQLAGMVLPHRDRLAIVPGRGLLNEAQRLLGAPVRPQGVIGIDVQPLTPALGAATGARTGVVVTFVDSRGPAARALAVGDVIEALDGQWLDTPQHWNVHTARLAAGDPLVLGVRRRGAWHDVQLRAAAPAPAGPRRPLGLILRAVPRFGSEVLRVERGSAAEAAGIAPGDTITLIGDVATPEPSDIQEAFAASAGRSVIVALTRGASSRVTALGP